MQYLLSEEEMAVIRDERMAISSKLRGDVRSHVEALTNLCKHVATTMIQTQAVNGGGVSDRPRARLVVDSTPPIRSPLLAPH